MQLFLGPLPRAFSRGREWGGISYVDVLGLLPCFYNTSILALHLLHRLLIFFAYSQLLVP